MRSSITGGLLTLGDESTLPHRLQGGLWTGCLQSGEPVARSKISENADPLQGKVQNLFAMMIWLIKSGPTLMLRVQERPTKLALLRGETPSLSLAQASSKLPRKNSTSMHSSWGGTKSWEEATRSGDSLFVGKSVPGTHQCNDLEKLLLMKKSRQRNFFKNLIITDESWLTLGGHVYNR